MATMSVLACLAMPGSASARSRCPPIATVGGTQDIAMRIRRMLESRGVSSHPTPGCPTVTVWVERTTGHIQVDLLDAGGQRAQRALTDVEAAATTIESFARTDLLRPLVAGPPPITRDAARNAALLAPEVRAPRRPSPEVLRDSELLQGKLALGVSAFVSLGGGADGSSWLGATLGGCAMIGPICTGVALRGAWDGGATGSSRDLATRRLGMDVLVTVLLPLKLGRVTLSPFVSAGAGWLRSSLKAGRGAPDAVEVDSGGPRLQTGLRVFVPLAGNLSLAVSLGGDLWPVASAVRRDEEQVIAGDPTWLIRGGVGVGFGLR